jgi:hypothetical protein
MKRTSFLFAALTAIALLSCSSDNSNPIAEDADYPQAPFKALQKVSPLDDEAQGIDPGQSEINGSADAYCGSMSVTAIGASWSSVATCDFTTKVPSGSLNASYQFVGSGPSSNGGAFSTDDVYIECGGYAIQGTPLSLANIYTTAFRGNPANVKCYLAFHGTCYGTPVGGGPCSLTVSNIRATQVYY